MYCLLLLIVPLLLSGAYAGDPGPAVARWPFNPEDPYLDLDGGRMLTGDGNVSGGFATFGPGQKLTTAATGTLGGLGASDMTVSFRFRMDEANWATILTTRLECSRPWAYQVATGPNGVVGWSQGTGHNDVATRPVGPGWHDIAFVRTAGVATRAYVNGTEVAHGLDNGGNYANGLPLTLGTDPGGHGACRGNFATISLDDVRLDARALTAEEIAWLADHADPVVVLGAPRGNVALLGTLLPSPDGSTTIVGPAEFHADASDDRRVAHVDFFIDGEHVCRDAEAPYTCSWEGDPGEHVVSAVATDGVGKTHTDNFAFRSV